MKTPARKALAAHSGRRVRVSGGRASSGLRSERSRVIDRLEEIITQDIGGRGLAVDSNDNLVTRCRGNLARAARHLAAEGTHVAIATGFFIAHAARPSIETDGPCGAIALAWLLAELGCNVTLVTDPLGAAAIEAGLVAAAPAAQRNVDLVVFPFDSDAPHDKRRNSNAEEFSLSSMLFTESFFREGRGESLTHLISIERAGPSWRQVNADRHPTDGKLFAELCPPEHQDQVHNFRGQIITPQTAKTHLLFDFVRDNNLPIRTIGIGDGGNEIGMGSIPWQVIQANIPSGLGARIACRVATDWTIACGVSNWGAYALGSAVAWLRRRPELLAQWTDDRERTVLAALMHAGAVDGVTGKPTLSVDGMPIEQHLAIWAQIREAARLQSNANSS